MRATSNKDSRLAEALKKQKQINTLISDLKGQISHEARREKRTLDSRRKILLGAWCLSMVQSDQNFKILAMAGLNKFLTREIDRAAFPELDVK